MRAIHAQRRKDAQSLGVTGSRNLTAIIHRREPTNSNYSVTSTAGGKSFIRKQHIRVYPKVYGLTA
jgi:hypothetical protein